MLLGGLSIDLDLPIPGMVAETYPATQCAMKSEEGRIHYLFSTAIGYYSTSCCYELVSILTEIRRSTLLPLLRQGQIDR